MDGGRIMRYRWWCMLCRELLPESCRCHWKDKQLELNFDRTEIIYEYVPDENIKRYVLGNWSVDYD